MKVNPRVVVSIVGSMLLLSGRSALATPVNIVSPGFTHFANFVNEPPADPISFGKISSLIAATVYGDFGWHNSPSNDPGFPEYAGIMLGNLYVVTSLRFQVHVNPFQDFVLQGTNATTTGLDGTWSDIFAGTVTNRTELDWQAFVFSNANAYSAYRVEMLNDYAGGLAMYRWELLGERATATPEPASMLLLGTGLAGLVARRRKLRRVT